MAESSVVPLLEIRDEFVTCEICLEYFDNQDKSPRILPCFHSFCCRCLESIWEKSPAGVRCPNCRQVWPVQNTISATFPQSKVLMNLVEYLTMKNKVDEIMCHECPNSSRATMRCLDCQEFMCEGCTACHNKFTISKDHNTICIKELVNMPHDDFFHQTDTCKKHNNMNLDLYCKECSTDICSSCVHVSHRDHEILDLKDVYEAKMDHMKTTLKNIQSSSERRQRYTSRLSKQNASLDSMKENVLKHIDDSYEEIIHKLSDKRKQMKEDVISNIQKQKADRNEQMKFVEQSEVLKADHVLHCKQAVHFARAADFIEMAPTLEDKLHSVMEGPELVDIPIQEVTIDDTFKQIDKIIEKTDVMWNGIIFNKTNEDEDVMKRILFPVDGQSEQYRTLLLPNIEYDAQKINQMECSINESGILVNKPSEEKHTDLTSGLQSFPGVTARTHVPTSGCAFWQTEVDCMVREWAELNTVIAEAGVCLDEHCDDTIGLSNNRHVWGVIVASCKTHNGICLCAYSREEELCCIPVTDFKTNSRLTVTLGLLVDIDNATLHIIRVDDKTVVHSIPNIDVSRPLMPMFGVYLPEYFDVKVTVSSGMDISVNRELLVLLSSLVK
ncbi:E3 ubiquitin-protein ligase TRIM56-like [Gigantopelta aegis]|uniref:E3 ubiquitin-protein ligase TRIM56-like n=1 Tax=Gigantopelta aegis TaxID=1735272 RepID=UPI001B889C2E|nr:E3 ubiquitin-protein ligase TRIM56-like [Gigantopelta aegis]XP_041373031.1 E3 ubiquitin-protein ligase TRIM56-like [Gigantopelta aegis]